jgi:hypothetical protein
VNNLEENVSSSSEKELGKDLSRTLLSLIWIIKLIS